MLPPIPTLKKGTIEATYEHVNRLVREESGENFDNVKEFIECNEKLNVFERKVQAIIVDSLRIKEGVINYLLSDDVHLIRRVLKCDWFFEDAVSPEFYETSIFPNVSFSTMCKIINKLSRNIKHEEHAERLFQFIRQNYGSKYAEMFLPRCSAQFISAYIAECKPLFHNNSSVKILMNICKRFPDIVISFLENVFQQDYPHKNARTKYTKLILYIAKNHPVVFLPFFEKCYNELFFLRFGKKLTKSFSTHVTNLVKKSSGRLLRGVIDKSVLFKCLTFKDQVDLLEVLVRSHNPNLTLDNWSKVIRSMLPLMKTLSPEERFRLMETAFTKIYNKKFQDHPEIWTLPFLEVLPVDYRTRIVDMLGKMKENEIMDLDLHNECEDSERNIHDIFIYLLSCENAFPKLSSLMLKMSTTARREILLKEMIRNCIINEDSQGLESVLNYILKRHKNDDPRMLLRISQYLQSVTPKMLNLNVWDLIEQLVTVILVNSKECYMYKDQIEKYIRYKLKNKLNPESQVKNMINMYFIQSSYDGRLVNNLRKQFSKEIIMLYYDEIMRVVDTDTVLEEVKENLVLALLGTINEYNSKTRGHRIYMKNLFRLVEEVDKLMKKPKYKSDDSILLEGLRRDPYLRDKYATHLLQVSLHPVTLQHLLKLDPEYIVISLDNILNDLFSIYGRNTFKKFITSRSRLDFLNLTSEIRKLTKEKFKTSVSCTRKINALKMYSYFATIEDFSELVRDYIPENERMSIGEDSREYLEIQMTVPQIIKNVKPDSKNLPLISKYLNRDFLRPVLTSFNSACLNSPNRMVLSILKEYFPHQTLSVKKVILYRITDISVNDEKLRYFWELWNTEKHPSIRTVLLRTISKCFYENPSREIFELLKKCISEADELIIKSCPTLSEIPAQYLNEYTICLWNFTERYENSRFTTNFRRGIIQHFAPMNIWTLSEDFCNMVIKKYLFDSGGNINVNNFTCYYLISNPYSMNQKLSLVLQLLRERRNNYGEVSSFLAVAERLAVNDPKRFAGVFEGILDEWPNIYSSVKMFDEYLQLLFAREYNRIGKKLNFDMNASLVSAELGKGVRVIFNQVPNQNFFLENFKNAIKEFTRVLPSLDDVTMIYHFLGEAFGREEAIIAIGLLPQTMISSYVETVKSADRKSSELNQQFCTLVNKLREVNDEVVKVHMNLSFSNVID